MTTLPLDSVLAAADALVLAARWDAALELLRTTTVTNPHDTARLAVAVASAEVDRAFWQRTSDRESIAAARTVLDGDPALAWDLDWLELRNDYHDALFGDERTPELAASLTDVATALRDRAPTPARRGWVAFYLGLIADNVAGDRAAAPPHYEEALALAEKEGDDLLASYPLRHLGDHANEAGDVEGARAQWERSLSLRQAAGFVPGALAQQLLLGLLAREAGDAATAAAIGTEVARWCAALGVTALARSAEELRR